MPIRRRGNARIISDRTRTPLLTASGAEATWLQDAWVRRMPEETRRAMVAAQPNITGWVRSWLARVTQPEVLEAFAVQMLGDDAPRAARARIAARLSVRAARMRSRTSGS